MFIQGGLVSGAHHVGLPSMETDWLAIRAFWLSLGLECRDYWVSNPSYDHAGAGPRLQVLSGTKLVVSYHNLDKVTPRGFLEIMMSRMHVALTMAPPALCEARMHQAFDCETHWGYGNTSVFLIGPYGLHVELVTTDPGYHHEPR